MLTLALTIGIVAVLMAGMAVGVVFGRRPLQGSCGGVAAKCLCEQAGTPGACRDGKGPPPPAPRAATLLGPS